MNTIIRKVESKLVSIMSHSFFLSHTPSHGLIGDYLITTYGNFLNYKLTWHDI